MIALDGDLESAADAELARHGGRVARLLIDPAAMSDDDCKRVIARYAAGVGDNFIKWLGAAIVSVRSLDARFAASENLLVEVRDDHPGMLRSFARGSGATPERCDYELAEKHLSDVQSYVSDMSGLYLTSLIHGFEVFSQAYIPWLGRLSRRLGNQDMTYVDIHGEADIHHARQLRQAVIAEASFHKEPIREIAQGYGSAANLLDGLLDPARTPRSRASCSSQ